MSRQRNAKGEGSFVTNPDGTVTHRKGVGYKPDGKRKTITVTAPTKAACIREMKKKEAEWNRKKAATHVFDKDTMVKMCLCHLKYQVENGELKPKSIDRREVTINQHIGKYDIGYMQVGSVTSADIAAHVNKLILEDKLSASSINKVVDVLNAAYDWAVRRGDLEVNPIYPIKPELKKKIARLNEKGAGAADVDALEADEVKLFEKEARKLKRNGKKEYPAGNYCLLLLHTGMRVGEMLALRWNDWDGETLVIDKSISMAKNRNKQSSEENNYIAMEGDTKNQKARIIELTEDANSVLKEIKAERTSVAPDEFIVVTRTGKNNTATNLEHRMKVIMKNAGLGNIKGGLHIFRKTFATTMYENGARTAMIAAYIGDLESTTKKYYIAIRKKAVSRGITTKIVKLPKVISTEEDVA